MFVRSMLLGACVFASAGPALAQAADLAFAKVSTQIVSFPVGDPGNATPVGPLADSLSGLDFDPGTDVLWAINFTGHTLGTISQSTGAYTPAVMVDSGITAFTIDPVAGTFYVAKGDPYVYSLDPVTGQTTLQGSGAAAGSAIAALAVDCGKRLFALAGNGIDLPDLYQAHLGVGDPTLIGPSGYSGPTSLEFDNHSGVLYAWFLPPGGGNTTSTHVTIDAATGQATPIASLDGRYRMAIRNECPIFADGFEA
jgi:hypothetical protein